MNYEKKLNKFFRHLNQGKAVLEKIKVAKQEYNNIKTRGNGENAGRKAKSKLTRLEKQLERQFEINVDKFIIYKDQSKSKVELEVGRELLENIDTYLKIKTKQNKDAKQNILKTKYEILFDLVDIEKGSEILDDLEKSNNDVARNNKIINELILKKNEKRRQLEEEKTLINLSLQQVVENLKTETNKALRKELLQAYNELLVKKQNIHDELQNTDIIEYKIGVTTTKNNVTLSNVEDLSEEKAASEEEEKAAEEKTAEE